MALIRACLQGSRPFPIAESFASRPPMPLVPYQTTRVNVLFVSCKPDAFLVLSTNHTSEHNGLSPPSRPRQFVLSRQKIRVLSQMSHTFARAFTRGPKRNVEKNRLSSRCPPCRTYDRPIQKKLSPSMLLTRYVICHQQEIDLVRISNRVASDQIDLRPFNRECRLAQMDGRGSSPPTPLGGRETTQTYSAGLVLLSGENDRIR
jgi:hypothetical protein